MRPRRGRCVRLTTRPRPPRRAAAAVRAGLRRRTPLRNAPHERARVHHRQGRARAQPQVGPARDPEEEARRLHRRLRIGQVLARVRHPLRGGAAALRRVALVLRPAVPRADGEAQVRHHPRALAHDLHRAEGRLEQPALDGRDDHRGARLLARALRLHRRAALPLVRPPGRQADGPADRRGDPRVPRGRAPSRARAARAEPQGRVPRALRRRAEARVRPRPRRRDDPPAHRPARARQEAEARHRAGRRSPGREGGDHRPAHGFGRDRAPRGEGHARRRRRGEGAEGRAGDRSRGVQEARPLLLRAERLPRLRPLLRRARAPELLLQLAARLLPRLPGARHARRDGRRPHHPGPLAHGPAGRGRALGERDGAGRGLDVRVRRAPLARAQDRPRHALGEAAEGAPRRDHVRHRRARRRPLVADRLRGRGEPAAAPDEGHDLGADAPLLHAVLLGQAVRDLRRRAAQAREPRRPDPRDRHRRALAPDHRRRLPLARSARPQGQRGQDRGRAPEGDPQPAQVPARRRARLPHARSAGAVALRRGEPAHPARLADGLRAHRRHLHPRRALDRASPAGQRQAARDAEAAPRHRQLGHRRRARRGDDGGGGLARRLRAGRRRPRRRDRVPGHARRGEARPELAHRGRTSPAGARSRSPRSGAWRTRAP